MDPRGPWKTVFGGQGKAIVDHRIIISPQYNLHLLTDHPFLVAHQRAYKSSLEWTATEESYWNHNHCGDLLAVIALPCQKCVFPLLNALLLCYNYNPIVLLIYCPFMGGANISPAIGDLQRYDSETTRRTTDGRGAMRPQLSKQPTNKPPQTIWCVCIVKWR